MGAISLQLHWISKIAEISKVWEIVEISKTSKVSQINEAWPFSRINRHWSFSRINRQVDEIGEMRGLTTMNELLRERGDLRKMREWKESKGRAESREK